MINLRGELKLNILGSNLKLTPISYDAVFYSVGCILMLRQLWVPTIAV